MNTQANQGSHGIAYAFAIRTTFFKGKYRSRACTIHLVYESEISH